jgi:hypothetical protein
MTLERRLQKLEQDHAPPEPKVIFEMCHLAGQEGGCDAPAKLSPEAHQEWHRERGHHVFTLDLKAASAARHYHDERRGEP